MSTPENDESVSDFKFYFILGALLFFAVPIRIPAPAETHIQKEFQDFIVKFNRTYHGNSSEYQRRYGIFKKTFEMLKDLRRQDIHPVFGINRFTDVSNDEFSQRYLLVAERSHNLSHRKRTISTASLYGYKLHNFGIGPTPLPQSVDWRKRSIITPIRNQGECGSCYVHSVIANVEAMHALKWNSSSVDELSVQQMIDCAGDSNYDGCQGGDTCQLLQWLKQANITILPKRVYQQQEHHQVMVSSQNNVCRNISIWPTTSQTVRVTDYTCLSFLGQEHEMLAFLAFKGPLIASVNALPWKQYVGGVIKGNCNGPLNHAVQIVGYDLGSFVEVPHFIVRNSWGTNFGYRGYAKIAIGENVCGIAEEVSSVTVD